MAAKVTALSIKVVTFLALVGTVWAANLALETWGVIEFLGVEAPAGVLFAGLAFGLRDVLHEVGGARWVLSAILVGATLSWWLSDAATIPGGTVSIAVASGCAFLFSELADFSVYAPLRSKHWTSAVIASNTVGAIIDSMLFLWLAFGSQSLLAGQVIGKMLMILPALPLVGAVRRK